jgi:phosphoribosylformylglycinamidine synthase
MSSSFSQVFAAHDLICMNVGYTTEDFSVNVTIGNTSYIAQDMPSLRDIWEATSFSLEKLQCNPACVDQERELYLSGTYSRAIG